MWAIAGVLLGLVLLASLVGFHTGPHSHAAAVLLGGVTAVWLLVMALTGQSTPALWLMLGADVAVSAGVGTAAWKGLKALHEPTSLRANRLEGLMGTAETDLNPTGTIRVRGEGWSATSLNGRIPAGTAVQVINVKGIRLEVWGEEAVEEHGARFSFDHELPPTVEPSDQPNDQAKDNRRAGSQ